MEILAASGLLTVLGFQAATLSVVVAYQRKTPWHVNLCWQCSVFFLVFIPFTAQSQFLDMFSMLDSGEFADHCKVNSNKIGTETHVYYKYGEGMDMNTENMLI